MSQDLNTQLNELLEKAFAAGTEQYHELGFKRRVGYGNRPAIIHIDMANAWTREGHPFSCENMDTIIPACQAPERSRPRKGHPGHLHDHRLRHHRPLQALRHGPLVLSRSRSNSSSRRHDAVKIDDRIAPATRRTGHHQEARQRLPRHQPPAVPDRQPHRHRDHHRRHRRPSASATPSKTPSPKASAPSSSAKPSATASPGTVAWNLFDIDSQIRRRRTPRERHLLPQQPPQIQRNHHPVTQARPKRRPSSRQ